MPHNRNETVREPLRVAFLGGGINSAVGRVHRAAIAMDGRFSLVAGCFSRHPEINRKTAEEYGVRPGRFYATPEELLKNEAELLDALVILSPTDQHREHVFLSLDAGIPVICEKTLSTSRKTTEEIAARLAEKKGFLAVTYNYLGYPMLREFQAIIAEGKLGKIQQVHVEMPQEGFLRVQGEKEEPMVPQSWRLRDDSIPTVSLDLGSHVHSIIRFLTGERPLEVVAQSNTFGNFKGIVDSVSCMARYSNDLVSNIWYGKTALGYRNGLKVRVFGQRGSAGWRQENPEILEMCDHLGARFLLDRAHPGARISSQPRYTRFKGGHPAGFIEAFANYYTDIADALNVRDEGKERGMPYVFGIDAAVEGARFLDTVSESSNRHSWMTVE